MNENRASQYPPPGTGAGAGASPQASRYPTPGTGAGASPRASLTHRVVQWARRKSPWILHFNSGGCNGCDIELLDLLTPRYDVERLGILKEASPRHADILLCSGPVTRQSRDRLLRIYEQMPAPKWVVAMGSCSCSGGVFRGGYNIVGGIDQVLPVDMYVFGCPCRPEAIIEGLARLLEKIK